MRSALVVILALTACETSQLVGSDPDQTCLLSECHEKDAGIDFCDSPTRAMLRVKVVAGETICGRAIELTRQGDYWVGEVH